MVTFEVSKDAQVISLDLKNSLEDYLKIHVQTMSIDDFVYLRQQLNKMLIMVYKSYEKGELVND